MFNVKVEKECGCFKKANLSPVKSFESKDDALTEANEWSSEMNETFCCKHNFSVVEDGNDFLIKVEMN